MLIILSSTFMIVLSKSILGRDYTIDVSKFGIILSGINSCCNFLDYMIGDGPSSPKKSKPSASF